MSRITLIIICLSILSFNLLTCQKQQVSKEDLLTTIDSLEHKMEWLNYRLSLEYWDLYTTGISDSLEYYQNLYNFVISDPETIQNLRNGKLLLDDENEIRRWKLIYATVLSEGVETDKEISQLRDTLSDIDINYRTEFEGEKRTAGYLYKTYRSNNNRSRRESAYRAWCSIGNEQADGLGRLFRMRNQRARQLGYNSYLALSFNLKSINLNNYLKLLKHLDSLSEQPYLKIIEEMQSRLNLDELEIWDLDYFYTDINHRVDRYFPVDSQMKYIKRSLDDVGFNLDNLPIYFDFSSRDGKSQFTRALSIKSPYDIRVQVNLSDGINSTRVLLQEIGRALHSAFISQDRSLYADMVDGSWSEGMAQITASMMDDKSWLAKYPKMSSRVIERYLDAKRDKDIINLRMNLLRLNFEYEAYLNPNRDLNKLYWNLFEKYLHLPKHEDIQPWATVISFTTQPVYLQNYLYAYIIAAQTINFIHKNYGSFIDNTMTNSFLVQNYYRFGARYDWRELLERGTNEALNPDYLIKQMDL